MFSDYSCLCLCVRMCVCLAHLLSDGGDNPEPPTTTSSPGERQRQLEAHDGKNSLQKVRAMTRPSSRRAAQPLATLSPRSRLSRYGRVAGGTDWKTQTPPIRRIVCELSSDLRLCGGEVQHRRRSAACPGLACFQRSLVRVGLSWHFSPDGAALFCFSSVFVIFPWRKMKG